MARRNYKRAYRKGKSLSGRYAKKAGIGKQFTSAGKKMRYVYKKHNGKLYKRKQKKAGNGWIWVGGALVLLAAATWAPAAGFSWLFKTMNR